MPNLNAKASALHPTSGNPDIKSQGVYADIAQWRRQQTLTDKQKDPVANSCCRRALYKTGVATHKH